MARKRKPMKLEEGEKPFVPFQTIGAVSPPWVLKPGRADDHYWQLLRTNRNEDQVALILVEQLNKIVRAEDIKTARLIQAAPAFQKAWSLVPEEIRQKIFDSLYTPQDGWVEDFIRQTEQP